MHTLRLSIQRRSVRGPNGFGRWRVAPLAALCCAVWAFAASPSAAQGGVEKAGAVAPQLPGASASRPDAAAWGTPRERVRFFLSGHSLTDDPLARNVEAVANSLGGPFAARFNQQIVIGSPIRVRTGMPANLDGYSSGKNRTGNNLNVVKELASGTTIGGDRYDTLLLTENHNLLDMLEWENTVKQVRHFHDRAVEANPKARTLLYASWWDINKQKPESWLATERLVMKGWECVGSRINQSLRHQSRADRVVPLPASLALVELVDRVVQGQMPSIAPAGAPNALDRVFTDNVHLTALGSYYMSLVTYAAMFERSPEGGFRPPQVSAAQAQELQALAWKVVSDYYRAYQEPALQECNTQWMPQICRSYFGLRNSPDRIAHCLRYFRADNPANPLVFNAATDAGFWFPNRP